MSQTRGPKYGALLDEVADLLRAIATSLGTPGGDASSHLGEARLIHTDAEKVALAVQNSVAATRWNPTGYRDRPAAEELDAALKTLGPVEHGTRDIARVLADAAPTLCLPPQTARPLSAFVHQVGDEVDAWATRVTGGEAPPEDGRQAQRRLAVPRRFTVRPLDGHQPRNRGHSGRHRHLRQPDQR